MKYWNFKVGQLPLKTFSRNLFLYRKEPWKSQDQTNFNEKLSMRSTVIVKIPFLEHERL